MNRDEITRKTSELSTPDTPAISLLKTVIRRKKKWHFSRAILPFRLAKRKSLSNACHFRPVPHGNLPAAGPLAAKSCKVPLVNNVHGPCPQRRGPF